jgi:hypothetical protein
VSRDYLISGRGESAGELAADQLVVVDDKHADATRRRFATATLLGRHLDW